MLIVLLAAIFAAVGMGAVLLWQRSGQPLATPPQTSTLEPETGDSDGAHHCADYEAGLANRPRFTDDSPAHHPGSDRRADHDSTDTEPTTIKPSTTKPTTTKPTKPKTDEDYLVRNPLYSRRIPRSDCSQPPRPLPTSQKNDERYLKNLPAAWSRRTQAR